MSFRIDPMKASVDFDCMTLDSFTVATYTETQEPQTVATVHLSGGLGRIQIKELGSHFTDDNLQVETRGIFGPLDDAQITEMKELFQRWKDLSTPLRYLMFSEKAVLLEDADHFIIFPPGYRHVNVGSSDK